jgi:hypothetical protein
MPAFFAPLSFLVKESGKEMPFVFCHLHAEVKKRDPVRSNGTSFI